MDNEVTGKIDTPAATAPQTGAVDERSLQDVKKGPGQEIAVARGFGAVRFDNVANVITMGQVMSRSGPAVPAHLRDNAGACTAVCFYASEWGMSPFAVANKSYVVKDRLAFESQLVHAVIEMRAPLKDMLEHRFEGEGPTRKCIVFATCVIRGIEKTLTWESPPFKDIQPKNSPLWEFKPDVQLFYNTSRDWARIYFPHILMGVYARDELLDSETLRAEHAKDVTPAAGVLERLSGAGEGFRPTNVTDGIAELKNVVADVDTVPVAEVIPPESRPPEPEQEPTTTRRRRKDAKEQTAPQTEAAVPEPETKPESQPAPEPQADPPTAQELPPEQTAPPVEAPATAPPAEPGKPKEPTGPEEYKAHWAARAASIKDEEAVAEVWRGEKDLRTKCMVTGEWLDDCIRIRNARNKDIREGRA